MDTDKTSAEDDPAGKAGVAGADAAAVNAAVSYTHLTLPTIVGV